MKELDKAVGSGKDSGLAAFVVFLTDSSEKLEPKVAELGKSEKIANVPLTIAETIAGPEKYKVDKNAEVTVILYANNEAKANFAFEKGKLDEKATKEIVAALPKITSK
ncbi:MAG: hypothetical protein ACRD2T_13150 [Thermoanaerobaculia bacterium]